MKLWVDDLRDPELFATIDGEPRERDWVWARTYPDAMFIIGADVVDELSLDHDLGGTMTGYDIAKRMEELVMTDKIECPVVLKCHSANPVGWDNIQSVYKRLRST